MYVLFYFNKIIIIMIMKIDVSSLRNCYKKNTLLRDAWKNYSINYFLFLPVNLFVHKYLPCLKPLINKLSINPTTT